MAYEIDFLPVGEGEKSGDAIALRFGKVFEGPVRDQRVVVIDGGFQASGEALVKHVKSYYQTDTVDLVISTHPDIDHISGLFPILENLTVKNLWIHQPWKHSAEFAKAYAEGRVSSLAAKEKLRKSLDDAVALDKLARDKGIAVTEPFLGTSFGNGAITVIGPSVEFYTSLVPDYRCFETALPASVLQKAASGIREAIKTIAESWGIETLSDECETSPENNSSVITLFRSDGEAALLTADAGDIALHQALDVLDAAQFNRDSVKFVQVPHHGSHHNVGPALLDRLIGPRRSDQVVTHIAFVSAAKDAPKHPAKKVANAFRRRGAPVHATQGQCTYHRKDVPLRQGWGSSVALPFYSEVEE